MAVSIGYCRKVCLETFFTLSEVRKDPEAFQKICLVALSAIRAINFHCHTNFFPQLVKVLDAAPVFDFYGSLRILHYFFHPYCLERFDEDDILQQVEQILCKKWGIKKGDKEQQEKVHLFAKKQLTAFLEMIYGERGGFRNEKDVKNVLKRFFIKSFQSSPIVNCEISKIDFSDLNINLKPISSLQRGVVYSLMCADVLCVPDFLQGWGLIDLAPYAAKIGECRFFSSIVNQPLGDYIWAGLLSGFFFQSLEAAQVLYQDHLTPEEKREAQWKLIYSAAECLYSISNLSRQDPWVINSFALFAKSLGLVVFLAESRAVFFENSSSKS